MTRNVRIRSTRAAGALFAAASLLAAASASAQIAFEARTDRLAAGLGNPTAVAVGDFVNTGDGLLDLAVTFARENALGIFENNGNGTFTLVVRRDPPPPPGMGGPPEEESNIGASPAGIVAIDLDGDTIRDDIAGVNQDIRFFAYENGGGLWTPSDPDASRGSGLSVAVGHWGSIPLPADNCDDLFTATQNGAVNIAVSRCDGSGSFEPVARFFRPGEVSVQTDIEVGDFVSLGGDAGQVDVLTLDNLNRQIVIWPGDPTLDINLLVADGLGNTLLVFKPVELAGQSLSPVQSIAQDWDGDGQLDLLVLTEQGIVLWYRGTGDPAMGGFEDPIATDLVAPLSPSTRQPTRMTSLAYADVVGADGASAPDGIADLIVADAGQSSGTEEGFNWLMVVPGTGPAVGVPGPPSFDVTAQYKYAAPNLGVLKPGSLAVADFGAGVADAVLFAFDSSNYTVFMNDGLGKFDAAPSFAVGGTRARGLAERRLGGGFADLVVVTRGEQSIAVLEGDGALGLAEPSTIAPSSGLALGSDVKVVDLDGDGIPDALVTHANEHVLYRGNPDGTFSSPEVLADGPRKLMGVSRLGELGTGSSPGIDLAIFDPGLGNSSLAIWLGNGDGSFAFDHAVDRLYNYSTHATGSFVTGTALDSIVVAGEVEQFRSPPALHLVAPDADGRYAVTQQIGFPSPFDVIASPVTLLIAADFTLDGRDDVVAVLGGGEAFLFASNGTALLPPSDFFSVGGNPRAGIAADLDGSGRPDLAVATRSAVAVLANVGGGFSPPLLLPSNIDNIDILAVDLDDDGLPELVVSSERTNDLTVFRNVSTPPFLLRVGPDPTGTSTRLSWPLADGGATYSALRGNLSVLWEDATASLLDATELPCLATGLVGTFVDDASPLPVPVGGWPASAFYLVRCEGGGCSDMTFGTDSFGVPRYANDPPEPCP